MPASDPVTAVANAVVQAGLLAEIFIEEQYAQKYNREHTQRVSEWINLISQPINPDIADRINTFVSRMLTSSGSPAGGMGEMVGIPMDTLTSLINECSEGIKKDQMLAKIQFRQK